MVHSRRSKLPLDQFTLSDVIRLRHSQRELVEYHHQSYFELAFQRSQVFDKIKTTLLEIAEPDYEFRDYFRAVEWCYSLQPLSYRGNLLSVGGRFNIGDIDKKLFPPFPALYFSEDFETSTKELFGGLSKKYKQENEDPYFNALATQDSVTLVKLRGGLSSVIDLTKSEKFGRFVNLITDFKISPQLKTMAKNLKLPQPDVIRTPSVFLKSVLESDWRKAPMLVDVPSNSQIFGQLVFESGISGILYPSRLTEKKCLAVFPFNCKRRSKSVTV